MLTSSLFSNTPEHTGGATTGVTGKQHHLSIPSHMVSKQRRPTSGQVAVRRMSDSSEHKKLLSQYKSQELNSLESMESTIISTKLIYTQQKLFWQIKGTIDFHLFEHIDSEPRLLELIPFDKTTGEELEHIYLCKDLILPRVQSEVKRRMEQKQAAMKSVRTKSGKSGSGKLQSLNSLSSFAMGTDEKGSGEGDSTTSSDHLIIEELTNEVIGEFVLARTLVVPPDGISADRLKVRIKQTSSEMADPSKLSILAVKPNGKSDLTIARPRRPSFVEFDSVLQSFHLDSEELQHAASSAALFSDRSTKAFEKLDVIKARPRSMSIDELATLERLARKGPEEVKLTAKERWLQTVQTIHAHRSGGPIPSSSASASSSPIVQDRPMSPSPARRSRGGRETFPNQRSSIPPSWSPTTLSPAKRAGVFDQTEATTSPGHAWNGGTRASPIKKTTSSSINSPPSKSSGHLPPRPSWNSSPSRRKKEEQSLGIAPQVSPSRQTSMLIGH